ncbi:DUF1949 domain-containing protein, partial [Streptomyces noursei]
LDAAFGTGDNRAQIAEVARSMDIKVELSGGIKLGAGGLIRAYGGVVGEALDALGTVTRQRFRLVTVTVDHQRAGRLENDLRTTGRAVREVAYGSEVRIEVGLPEADLAQFRAWLADATAGTARLELGGEAYGEV